MKLFSKPYIPEGFSSFGKVKPIAIDPAFPKKGDCYVGDFQPSITITGQIFLDVSLCVGGVVIFRNPRIEGYPKNAYRKSLKTGPFPKPWLLGKGKRVQVVNVLASIGNLTTKDTENLVLFSMQRET